jgi:hypothetical protein
VQKLSGSRRCATVFFLALAVALLIAPGRAVASATIPTFTPIAGARVTAVRPYANLGRTLRLGADASPRVRSYLRFDVAGLSSSVVRVSLRVYIEAGTRRGFRVYRVRGRGWRERTVTFANAPALATAVGVASGPLRAGRWTTVDVTQLVRERLVQSRARDTKPRRYPAQKQGGAKAKPQACR